MKRISGRAIIFKENKTILMHRIKKDIEYFTFIGGGIDKNETIEDCIKRETFEELGINVKCKKLVYIYESKNSLQFFYLTEYSSGKLGTGNGEEFNENEKYGKYIPEEIDINDLENINIEPVIIKNQFLKDINKFGIDLSSKSLYIGDLENEY